MLYYHRAERKFMQKQNNLQKLYRYFSGVGDKLGMGIDQEILETVVVFNALEIPTSASCEGHTDHGINGPWVDIESKDIELLNEQIKKILVEIDIKEKSEASKEEVEKMLLKLHKLDQIRKNKNLEIVKRILNDLELFYKNKEISFDKRLIIIFYGSFARIISQGADMQDLEPARFRQEKLLEYQKEMKSFTKFLKEKYI